MNRTRLQLEPLDARELPAVIVLAPTSAAAAVVDSSGLTLVKVTPPAGAVLADLPKGLGGIEGLTRNHNQTVARLRRRR